MSAHNLINVLTEHQIAHLRTGINIVNRLQSVGVPEPNTSVSSPST